MSNNPTERVEEIFCAAIEIGDADARTTYVKETCGDDDDLREAVERMLTSFSGGQRLFESISPTSFSVVELTKTLDEQADASGTAGGPLPDDSEIGKTIGPYRLLKKIGEGGGGNVYLAQQEKPVRRHVALKIIKQGMDTKSVIARFETERQALAMMEHPNIAHVLNAGETDTGRPYFVMELVHGIPVTTYCEENKRSIQQRLELFIQICHAIQHAHQKGIIHRDIKPSNILIEPLEGMVVPKVIDFGIAKATGDQLQLDHTEVTSFQPLVGTPAYMSPEQADLAEKDIDVRSDIYSLGVLLYELLAGRTPFDQKKLIRSGLEEMLRTIREREPPRPSVKLSGLLPEEVETIADNRKIHKHHLMASLEGDLDWIVMKALDKERDRRYQSADGLAEDIQRYLNHEPVIARPPSRRYRFRKLVRRNKAVFAAVSIAAFGLLAGFGTSTWMFFRERAARLEQERLQQHAQYRALIAQAAVRIKYGDMDEADALLARVPFQQTPSSLEAAEAYQAIANWHIQEGRIKEAGTRFSSMARALASVDPSDVPQVSASMMPAGAVVAYAGTENSYEEFRKMAIRRFGDTMNAAVARQMIKVCLLVPADPETLQALAGPARVVEEGFESPQIDQEERQWADLSLALINYRSGTYTEGARWVSRYFAAPEKIEVLSATIQIIRAMIEKQVGLSAMADVSLEKGRTPVKKAFADKSWINQSGGSSWFDWLIADLLLKEAEGLRVNVESPLKNDPVLLFNLGELDMADAALEGMQERLPATQASASMLRELGDRHAVNGRWEKAKARFDRLFRIHAPEDPDGTMDDFRSAAVLVEQGYEEEYGHYRESVIAHHAGTESPPIAQRVLRECLLAPADQDIMKALEPYAAVTERTYRNTETDQSMRGWQAYAMALWTYRTGDYERCLHWCELADPARSGFPTRNASVLLLRSLALHGLGRIEQANRQLEETRPLIAQILSEKPPASLGWPGFWFDWACVRIHLREAESVLEPESDISE